MTFSLDKLFILLISLVIFYACSGDENTKYSKGSDEAQDSIITVNKCSNDSFTSILEENKLLDSNAFILTIQSKNGFKKREILDLRPGLTSINYCTNDYVVVGFACGGPCYSQVFVPIKKGEPNQQFHYANQVNGKHNIITHFENEEFENLVIQNLDNGKKIKIDISDCEQLKYSPCYLDTQYIVNNKIYLKYNSESNHPKIKSFNLQEILK